MDFLSTKHPEVKIIKPNLFEDHRGYFMESYNLKKFKKNGINLNFVQDNYVKSNKNTLRGLHFQKNKPQAKLVKCIIGKIFDVAVDIRKESPYFKKWVGVELSGKNKFMLYVPEGFAHGYYVMSETSEVSYKCSNIYYKEFDAGICWNDPDIGITWPCEEPILSQKDKFAPRLLDLD